MLKKLFSHSLIYAMAPQLPKVINIFILPILTADLTAFDYGVYGVVTAYTGALEALKTLGLVVVLANTFYQYPNRWPIIWRQLYGLLIVWAWAFVLIKMVVLLLLVPAEAADRVWEIIFYTCLPNLFFHHTIILGVRYHQLSEKPLYIGIVSAVTGLVTIGMNLLTISYWKMGYMGWFISTMTANAVAFCCYVIPLNLKYGISPVIRWRPRFLRHHLSVALPTVPHNYSTYLLNFSDRIVLDGFKVDIRELGEYNLAYTFGNYLEMIGNAVGFAVGPFILKLCAKGTPKAARDSRSMIFFLQVCFMAGIALIALWSREIFDILISNDELKQAYPFAIVIVMGFTYRPMYWAVVDKLIYHHKTKELWKISFIGGGLNLGLNLIFVPIYGVWAAPITTFVALMYLGFSGYYVKAYRDLNDLNHYPLLWLTGICVSTVGLFIIRDVDIWIKASLTGLGLGICAILFLIHFPKLKTIEL